MSVFNILAGKKRYKKYSSPKLFAVTSLIPLVGVVNSNYFPNNKNNYGVQKISGKSFWHNWSGFLLLIGSHK